MHDEAARAEDTDWPQILALYGLLKRMSDNPMVTLNHAIAAAMVHGPQAGLTLLERSTPIRGSSGHYRLDAVRAHLLEMAGDREARSHATARRRTARRAFPSGTTWRPRPPASRTSASSQASEARLRRVFDASLLVCSVAAATLMRKLLFDTPPWDVSTLAAMAAVLALSALLASYIPARRAASVDPVEALRAE